MKNCIIGFVVGATTATALVMFCKPVKNVVEKSAQKVKQQISKMKNKAK